MVYSVNVLISFVIGAREEANSAFNQSELIAVGVHFGRIQNGMSEVVNESVVRIVSFGAVDDNGLQVFIPTLRIAEEFAKSPFAINGVGSEAVDEFFRNIFVNIVGIGVAEIIFKSRPNVVANEFLEFVHFEDLQK